MKQAKKQQHKGKAHPGWHAAESAVKQYPQWVLNVWLQQGREDQRSQKLQALLQELDLPVEHLPKSVLDQYSQHHQGVIAWVKERALPAENELMQLLDDLAKPDPLLLILDGVQDPHNLGACLRTADAVGVDAVIIPKHQAVGITPTVSKVACGAAESLPVFQVTNLARTLTQLKDRGVWLSGLALSEQAQSIFAVDWRGAVGIVMGAEDTGIRALTQKHCDRLLIIPMQGSVQSLNVSVATGVVLYTALQQRLS